MKKYLIPSFLGIFLFIGGNNSALAGSCCAKEPCICASQACCAKEKCACKGACCSENGCKCQDIKSCLKCDCLKKQ